MADPRAVCGRRRDKSAGACRFSGRLLLNRLPGGSRKLVKDMKCPLGKTNRRQRIRSIALVAILGLAALLYGLADRYLIEHVEGKVGTTTAAASTAVTASQTDAESDAWNYESDDIEVHIKKVESGSGNNKVTYYVADVQLKDAENLKTAFAKNEFGRNIVETTSEIASDNGAIFAINGDYYGFRSDGMVIRNGVVYRDNAARTGLAVYENGEMESYDETDISSSELLKDGVLQTFSFGPVLIEDGQTLTDFAGIKIDKNFGNHSIQDYNPRTGIGMISANHYIFIVADGRAQGYSRGVTLEEFAQLFADYGCQEAYNLDGGGSSTMYFMGRVVNNPLGRNSEREISDIIYIAE